MPACSMSSDRVYSPDHSSPAVQELSSSAELHWAYADALRWLPKRPAEDSAHVMLKTCVRAAVQL